MPIDREADRVAAAVEEIVPLAAPVRPAKGLRKGRSHRSWVMQSSVGPLVAKVSSDPPDQVVIDRLAEHQRVSEFGVPVPRLLGYAAASRALGNRLLVVAEYLQGSDAEELLTIIPDDQAAEVMEDVGRALAALHGVPVRTFGKVTTGLGAGPSTWGEYVAGRVDVLQRAYSADAQAGQLISDGLGLLLRRSESITALVNPAVAHLDIYLPNLLLDESQRFRALLDLEHLRWVDPVMDFVKPAMWIFAARPHWAVPFARAYRSAAGWPQRWRDRMSVATGLELLTGVEYWQRIGEKDMLSDYRRQLVSWVGSEGDWIPWPTKHE